MTFAALVMRKILKNIGESYKKAMRWLLAGLVILVIGGWHQYGVVFFFNNESWYTAYGVSFWPLIIGGLVFLRAGYAFNMLHIGPSTRERSMESIGEITDKDYVDSILAAAQLASQLKDIDPVLDELRQVTAIQKPGVPMSDESKQRLIVLYQQIEVYLLHKDPLRDFTLQQVRDQIRPAFRNILEQTAAQSS